MKRNEFERKLYKFYKDELRVLYNLKFNPLTDEELYKSTEYNYQKKKLDWANSLIEYKSELSEKMRNEINVFAHEFSRDLESYVRYNLVSEDYENIVEKDYERNYFDCHNNSLIKSYEDTLQMIALYSNELYSKYKSMQNKVNKSEKQGSFLSRLGEFIKFKNPSQKTLRENEQSEKQ